jgi:hypothetical protein
VTEIFEVLCVNRPYMAARIALHDIVSRFMSAGPWTTLALSADMGLVTVRKEVRVRFAPAIEETHFDEMWSVDWTPANGGPSPDFNGLLMVHYAYGGLAELQLSGKFAPPLGAPAKDFDLELGQRIAANSCRSLLKELGHRIEDAVPMIST